MKTFLRYFITTVTRFTFSTSLNILGLSVAFAAFCLIMMQVKYDLSYDKFHSKSDNIYRVEISEDSSVYNPLVGRKWAELIQNKFPQISLIGLRMSYAPYGKHVKVEQGGQFVGFKEESHLIHPDFVEVFDFEMTEGSRDAIKNPGTVLIPQSIARVLWQKESVVGEPIIFSSTTDTTFTVGGVYKDFPRNTLVENVIYIPINPNVWSGWDGWQYNYELFITLSNPDDKKEIENNLYNEVVKSSDIPEWLRLSKNVRLNSLTDIHFGTNDGGNSNKTATIILFIIAILIVSIATINYINYATSLTPMRIKSINIQKVLGSKTSIIRWAVIIDAICICAISYILSIFIIGIVNSTQFISIFSADTSLDANKDILLLCFTAALFIGVIAGVYPAYYSTKFAPVLALKGSFGMSARGRLMRTMLISFQFVISIILIIASVFLKLQHSYMLSINPGYNTEQIAILELNRTVGDNNHDLLVSKLMANPSIKNVASSQFVFGTGDTQIMTAKIGGQNISFAFFPADEEFLRLMDIEVIEGRDFRSEDNLSSGISLIFNKAAKEQFNGLEEGTEFGEGGYNQRVIGFTKNIQFRSARHNIDEPLSIALIPKVKWPITYIKISGDITSAVNHIKKSIAEIDPTYPIDIKFYDTVFNEIYQNDKKMSDMISSFSLLAIIISLIGTFGVVVFETQYRRKEIGLRKVMGSTIFDVVMIYNRRFFYIVLGCFAIAAPIAYIIVNDWLESFAYRVPIYWWVFLICLIILIGVTLITVTVQSFLAATENPVKSIKSE